jgi:UDPglucose 6-dehydrogenase
VKNGETVAVLGMSYRPDTYIVEESAGLHIAQTLKRHGCCVLVHDCAANPQKSPSLLEFEFLSDPAKMSNDIKAVLICCPWDGYKKISFPKDATIFDPWGVRK